MPLKAPAWWEEQGAASTLLLPAAVLYGAAHRLKRAVQQPLRVSVPVVCVGNLVAGGAGKTPVALMVAKLLRERGLNPLFLSRGYGGSLRGPLLVNPALHTAKDVGDEPLLLAKHAPAVVAADRAAGAQFAIAKGAGAIVMDDGFQNNRLHKDFSVLVVDASYGFGNGRLLPAGPLREPVADGFARADAVIAMEGDLDAKGKPLFHGLLQAEGAERWRGRKVVAFAGLGRPEKFHRTLDQLGVVVVSFEPFADHHLYRANELHALESRAKAQKAALVTTEKDAMRLPEEWRRKVEVLKVEANIAEAEQFGLALEKAVQRA